MSDATLSAKLKLDSSQFGGGLNKAVRDAHSSIGKISAQFATLKNIAVGGAVGMAFNEVVRSMFSATLEAEKLEAAMAATAGSAALGKEQLRQVRSLSADIGLSLDASAKAMIQLQAAGMTAGEAMKAIRAGFNAVASTGGGSEEFSRVAVALQQLRNSPKPLQEEINQLREALPTTAKLMNEAFGSARAEDLQKLGISGRQFVDVIVEAMAQLPQLGDTMGKQIARFDAQLQEFSAKLGESFKPVGGSLMSEATKFLEIWRSDAQEIGDLMFRIFDGGDPNQVRADSAARLAAEEGRAAKRIAEKRALDAFRESMKGNADAMQKSEENAAKLRGVIEKMQTPFREAAKAARELRDALNLEDLNRTFLNADQTDALNAGLAETQRQLAGMIQRKRELADAGRLDDMLRFGDAMGILQGLEKDAFNQAVQDELKPSGQRRAERRAERDEERAANRVANRMAREEFQKERDRFNKLDGLKKGEFFDAEGTRKRLRQDATETMKRSLEKSTITLGEIRDIMKSLATA